MYAKEQTIADPDKPYNPSGEGQPKWSEVAYSPVFKSGVGGASWAYMIDQPAVCRKRCEEWFDKFGKECGGFTIRKQSCGPGDDIVPGWGGEANKMKALKVKDDLAPLECSKHCDALAGCTHYSVKTSMGENCYLWQFATTPSRPDSDEGWSMFRCSNYQGKCIIFTKPVKPVIRLSTSTRRPRFPRGLICIANTQCQKGFAMRPGDDPNLQLMDPSEASTCTLGEAGNYCKGIGMAREKKCLTGGAHSCCATGDDPTLPEKPVVCYTKGLDKVVDNIKPLSCNPDVAKGDIDCASQCQKYCAGQTPTAKMFSFIVAAKGEAKCFCFDPGRVLKSFPRSENAESWDGMIHHDSES